MKTSPENHVFSEIDITLPKLPKHYQPIQYGDMKSQNNSNFKSSKKIKKWGLLIIKQLRHLTVACKKLGNHPGRERYIL